MRKFIINLGKKILWAIISILGYLFLASFKNGSDKEIEKKVKELEKEEETIKEEIKNWDKIIKESQKKDKEIEKEVKSWLEKLNQLKNTLIVFLFSICLLFCFTSQSLALTPEEILDEAEIIILKQQEQINEKNEIILGLRKEVDKLILLLDAYKQLNEELSNQQARNHGIMLGITPMPFEPRLNIKYIYKQKWFGYYVGINKGKDCEIGITIWIY